MNGILRLRTNEKTNHQRCRLKVKTRFFTEHQKAIVLK